MMYVIDLPPLLEAMQAAVCHVRPAHGGRPSLPIDWSRPLVGGPVKIEPERAEQLAEARDLLVTACAALDGEQLSVASVDGRMCIHGGTEAIRALCLLADNAELLRDALGVR